jgi:hypothetical protein
VIAGEGRLPAPIRATLRHLPVGLALSLTSAAFVALLALNASAASRVARDATGPPDATRLHARERFDLETRDRLRGALPGILVGGARSLSVGELAPPLVPAEELEVLAADEEWLEIADYAIEEGRGVTPADAASAARVCLVSTELARGLASRGTPIGRNLRLDATWLTVVGRLADSDEPGRPDLVVPLETALRRMVTEEDRGFTSLLVDIPGSDEPGQLLLGRVRDRLAPTSELVKGDLAGRDVAWESLARGLTVVLALLAGCASLWAIWISIGLARGRSPFVAVARGAALAPLLATPGLLLLARLWWDFAEDAFLEPRIGVVRWSLGLLLAALLGAIGGALGARRP